MDLSNTYLYSTLDSEKKDAKWANTSVTLLRRNWLQLKTTESMREMKRIIFDQISMEPTKKMFKDKDFLKHTKFDPIAVWTRILNILVEEITKNPPRAELRANDASALSDKEEDIRKLRLKGKHEKLMATLNKRIGDPPTIIGNDQFKTNIDEFYRMGLDPNDEEDIDFYEQTDFPRLKYEIAGQKIIDAIMKLNRFDKELIRSGVIDIVSGLCFCLQTYVDKVTGEIKYDRIYPEEAYGIWGDLRDGADDVCKGWVKNLTVSEWLSRVGNDFSFERDWTQLLWGINYTNKTKYTGFRRFGTAYDCWGNADLMANPNASYNGAAQSDLMDYSRAYQYNIYCGYIEWDSPEATATYLAKFNTGEVTPQQIPFDTFLDQKKEVKEYYKESWYAWRMYGTYFLPTSSISQWIYGFGKLYYSTLHGANDEYCKGTLMYYRLEGNPAAQLSKPYIEFANLCYYRMKWVVYHSKPQKEQHVMEELIKVAKGMQRLYPQNASSAAPKLDDILTQLIQYKRENFVDIRSFPEIEGKTYPVLVPQEGAKGGVDALAIGLQAIEQWLEMQVAEKVGLNDMRLGQIKNAREGYKKGEAETAASINSTSYVFRMVQQVKEHCATTTLTYSQDIVRFNDTVPYKWLLKILGKEEFENSKLLKEYAAHRYGLTVEEYVSQQLWMDLKQAANLALDKGDGRGGISLMEWGIVNKATNYDDALRKLALFKYKADKKLRKQKLEELKITQQNIMEQKAADKKLQDDKDENDLKGKDIIAKAQMYVADKNVEGKIDVKKLGIENEPVKQETRSDNQVKVAKEKSNIQQQEAVT